MQVEVLASAMGTTRSRFATETTRKGYGMFSQQEHASLQTQLLARLATVEPDGRPGFSHAKAEGDRTEQAAQNPEEVF